MAIPLPFALNDANFLQRLREAVSSGRIINTRHALKRMKERRITPMQVQACLLSGRVVEPAHLTPLGDWKATVEYRHAGDSIRVAVVLKKMGETYAVVVTVMN